MSSGRSSLPPSTLYPIIFALISLVVIVLFVGLTMAVRLQNKRNRRYLAFLQAHYDEVERQRLRDEIDRPRPVMWEIEGDTGALKRALWAQAAHTAVGRGASPTVEKPHQPLTWSGMSPASAVPLAHPANKRVLPSTCPPLVLSTLILQPRPPRHHHRHGDAHPPGFAEDDDDDEDDDSDDDEDANDGSHHHHHHHAGVEVDLGTERVELEGDWRKVVGRTDLGFEF